ncbi:GtrA family protein [Aureimonas frigidaquae]|uniref:GtrA family protein n=1 Tax=Aureimonas frigidaquae TaxID=424757 RepID=UPI000782F587
MSPFRGSRYSADAIRFLIAGLVNTGFTFLLYQALLFITQPTLAYACAWLAGIAFVAILYPNRVFVEGRTSLPDRLILALVYASVFIVGLGALYLVQSAGIGARTAILGVLIFTTGLNFFLSRTVLRR